MSQLNFASLLVLSSLCKLPSVALSKPDWRCKADWRVVRSWLESLAKAPAPVEQTAVPDISAGPAVPAALLSPCSHTSATVSLQGLEICQALAKGPCQGNSPVGRKAVPIVCSALLLLSSLVSARQMLQA